MHLWHSLFAGVVGKTTQKKDALAVFVTGKAVIVGSAGRRGHPFTYSTPTLGQAENALNQVEPDKEVENSAL